MKNITNTTMDENQITISRFFYKIFFTLMISSITVSVVLILSLDWMKESFLKNISIIISLVLTVFFLVSLCFVPKKVINKKTLLTSLIIAFLCAVAIKWCCSFTIDKWNKYPALRPLMSQDLCYSAVQYNTSYDNVSKKTHPNFLGLYSRAEIKDLLSLQPVDNSSKHVTVILDVFEEYCDYDIYFAYKDYNGKDFWMIVMYNGKSGNYSALASIDIVPEGTIIDHTPKS